MSAFEKFLAMGGYAKFVWPSYAIAALVLAGLYVVSIRALKRNAAALKRLEAEDGRVE